LGHDGLDRDQDAVWGLASSLGLARLMWSKSWRNCSAN
jgi:hypothetical protein